MTLLFYNLYVFNVAQLSTLWSVYCYWFSFPFPLVCFIFLNCLIIKSQEIDSCIILLYCYVAKLIALDFLSSPSIYKENISISSQTLMLLALLGESNS